MECCSCITLLLVIGSVIAYFLFKRKDTKPPQLRKHDYKPDTVYLYQFPRTKAIPNLSPFCLKVETFLKANKIPYEVCPLTMGRSQYGLLPFIELNGEHIADSQVIINRLSQHFNIKPLSSPRDEAIARIVDRTADIHTFQLQLKFKVLDGSDDYLAGLLREMGFPSSIMPIALPIMSCMFKRKIVQRIHGGVGMLSTEEFRELLKKDLDAYRDLLGERKFLFGDHITATDCTLFAHLATNLFIPANTYTKTLLRDEYPTLVSYCERIRDEVFGKEFAQE